MSKSPGSPRGVSVAGVLLHLLPAAFFFLLFVAVGLVHVTSRVRVVDAGYRLSRLQQENRELVQANDKLKLELATLKSPLRLERLAREQLGMAPPSAAAVINLATVGTAVGAGGISATAQAKVSAQARVAPKPPAPPPLSGQAFARAASLAQEAAP